MYSLFSKLFCIFPRLMHGPPEDADGPSELKPVSDHAKVPKMNFDSIFIIKV